MYIEDKQVIRVNVSYHACVETWEESGLLTMCVTGDDALVMLLLSLRSSAMQHHQDRDNTFTYPLHIFISLLSYWASLQAGDLLYHAPVVLLFCCVRAASQVAAQVDKNLPAFALLLMVISVAVKTRRVFLFLTTVLYL